jgi:hypothetical protein
MNDKHTPSKDISLPPRLPRNEAELNRTIILLGNRKQVELNAEARRQLETLIGVYPTVKEAALWKRAALARIRTNSDQKVRFISRTRRCIHTPGRSLSLRQHATGFPD